MDAETARGNLVLTVSPRLLRLYRRTDYVVDGHRSMASDALLLRLNHRRAALITAANPRSRSMAEAWNRRMTRNLSGAVRRAISRPAEGRLGVWREAGLLVCGDLRPLARLGRRFRQNAIVLVETGRPARLLTLVACVPDP